jgi:hypothetical protein
MQVSYNATQLRITCLSTTFFRRATNSQLRRRERLIDWLIIYCLNFTSHSRIFHLYGDVTFAGEGLQNLGLCSALRVFEQGEIFIVPHLLWHGTSVFQSGLIRRTTQFSRLLRHVWGCGGSILTRIIWWYCSTVNICFDTYSIKISVAVVWWIWPLFYMGGSIPCPPAVSLTHCEPSLSEWWPDA